MPALKVQIPQVDLKMVFKPYGNVLAVEDHHGAGGGALITYDKFDNAAMAVKVLSGKELNGVQGTLQVTFAPPTAASATAPSGPPPPESMGRKFICRIDIGIPNDKDFQVSRRIIGFNGVNMKRINHASEAKLRLRGRGSGSL